MYALIGLCFVLVGVAGLQFTYLFYADRLQRLRRAHIKDLEHHNAALTVRLDEAHRRIAEQDELLDSLMPVAAEDESWAEVIEDR